MADQPTLTHYVLTCSQCPVLFNIKLCPGAATSVQLHIVKNFLVDAGCFDASLRVPLILGIWGGKGQGKSFQTELAFKKLQ